MMKPRMNYHCSHRRAGMYLLMETEKIRMAREQEGGEGVYSRWGAGLLGSRDGFEKGEMMTHHLFSLPNLSDWKWLLRKTAVALQLECSTNDLHKTKNFESPIYSGFRQHTL